MRFALTFQTTLTHLAGELVLRSQDTVQVCWGSCGWCLQCNSLNFTIRTSQWDRVHVLWLTKQSSAWDTFLRHDSLLACKQDRHLREIHSLPRLPIGLQARQACTWARQAHTTSYTCKLDLWFLSYTKLDLQVTASYWKWNLQVRPVSLQLHQDRPAS